MRMHCVPGNHDVRDQMRLVCSMPPFSYCAYEEIGDWLLIGLDSCVDHDAGGLMSADELERFAETTASSDARHVMVCMHHPPVAMLKRLSTSGRVRLVVFDHVHQAYDEEHHGIRIIATPSTCRQFQPGSETFAVDDNPPAYRRITLHEDGAFDTELVWVGDD